MVAALHRLVYGSFGAFGALVGRGMTGNQPRRSHSFAVRLGRIYARWRIGKELDGLHVEGLDRALAAMANGPVVFAANHVGWWDGLLIMVLDGALDAHARTVVDAATVARLPFLRAMGFVGLRGAALSRVRRFLDRPGRTVWIFPQGRHRPAHLRPLGFHPGAGFLARRGALLVPVSIQYVFRDHSSPTACIYFGEPVNADELETAVSAGLDRLDCALPERMLIPSRSATTDAGLGAKMLSWFIPGREEL